MTEALSSLNRDQLQKLIQFAVNDTPEMLENVFRRIGVCLLDNAKASRAFQSHIQCQQIPKLVSKASLYLYRRFVLGIPQLKCSLT